MTRLAAGRDPWSLALAGMFVSCAWFLGARNAPRDAGSVKADEERVVRVRADALSREPLPPAPAGAEATPWAAWTDGSARPVPAASDDPNVTCSAMRTRFGAVLVVRNESAAGRAVRMAVRMPAGVYSGESIVAQAEGALRRDRLRPVVAGAGDRLASAWLPPGASAAFRWTERTRSAAEAFRAARKALSAAKTGDAALARRVGVPLAECGSHVAAGLRLSQQATRYEAVPQVHRALFTASHAVTLVRNARPGRAKRELQRTLEALEGELSELSAALLNIALNIAEIGGTSSSNSEQAVAVSVTNYGRRSIEDVRVEMKVPWASVRPAETVVLGTLAPGQAARATFRFRPKSGAECKAAAYVGYRSARSPARLCLDVPVDGVPSDARADDEPSSSAATPTPADQRETPGVPGEGTRP